MSTIRAVHKVTAVNVSDKTIKTRHPLAGLVITTQHHGARVASAIIPDSAFHQTMWHRFILDTPL